MKTCTKCRKEKQLSEFYVRNKATGRIHAECKECYRAQRNTYAAEHYRKYGDAYRMRAKIRRLAVKRVLKLKILEYLDGKSCEVCGESDIRTFEFDHLDPSTKSFNIAQGIRNTKRWEDILVEINKCRILCTNCHKKHTSTQYNWYKNWIN